jgi:hypothetical protein
MMWEAAEGSCSLWRNWPALDLINELLQVFDPSSKKESDVTHAIWAMQQHSNVKYVTVM